MQLNVILHADRPHTGVHDSMPTVLGIRGSKKQQRQFTKNRQSIACLGCCHRDTVAEGSASQCLTACCTAARSLLAATVSLC